MSSTSASTSEPRPEGPPRLRPRVRRALGGLRPRTRLGMPMAWVLTLAFGSMMVAALGAVLATSYYTAASNTRILLADKINLTLDRLTAEVRAFLEPAERQLLRFEAHLRVAPELVEDDPLLTAFAAGLLTATPQLSGIGILSADGRLLVYGRDGGPPSLQPIEHEDVNEAFTVVGDRAGVVWSNPLYSETLGATLINARLLLEGEPPRLLVAGVRLEEFARFLDQLGTATGQAIFVLHGDDRVVGATGQFPDDSRLAESAPLPALDQIDDAALRAIWSKERSPLRFTEGLIRGEGHRVSLPTGNEVFAYRRIEEFADLPWLVGIHLPEAVVGAEVRRLAYTALLGLAILLAAMLASYVLGRRLARPVEALADRADAIRDLRLADLPRLKTSRIAELDQAAAAFDTMTAALRWFAVYLPHRLVSQLMDKGAPDALLYEEREVTVMFTDIVGFTSRTREMSGGDVAALLNAHFAALEGCIEAEDGVIDKFIGDSMMAFWGAPGAQPDHAVRAVRAALAIARVVALSDGPPLPLRIGIQSGPVLVGNIGAPGRLNYTVVGETVNAAQRLEQMGREHPGRGPVTILIGAATAASIDAAAFDLKNIGDVELRGTGERITVYALDEG
ncbi:MAG: adenylate/guanylate cyclase domain-containing protein [Geminicoccaceae bacterium]|nr:adenylate/guanylate cyclase domain-containing protein [Geminicoccaceae bacterium]